MRLVACFFTLSAALAGCKGTDAPLRSPNDPAVSAKPARKKKAKRPDLELASVPASVEQAPDMTFRFAATTAPHSESVPSESVPKGENQAQFVQVSRTKDRLHRLIPHEHQEWLFVRNPVDPRRVTGLLILHDRRVIVEYPGADLRREGIAKDWAQLVTFDDSKASSSSQGVDAALLKPPTQRFPDYQYFEISDWREELHENGHNSGQGQTGHAGHKH